MRTIVCARAVGGYISALARWALQRYAWYICTDTALVQSRAHLTKRVFLRINFLEASVSSMAASTGRNPFGDRQIFWDIP